MLFWCFAARGALFLLGMLMCFSVFCDGLRFQIRRGGRVRVLRLNDPTAVLALLAGAFMALLGIGGLIVAYLIEFAPVAARALGLVNGCG